MPSSILRRDSSDATPRWVALWIGVAAGPMAWAALLETNYVLSYVACEQRHKWMLHLSTFVAIAIVCAGAAIAWRAAPPFGDESEPSTNPNATALLAARFLAMAALVFCGWFLIVILATHVPVLLLGPCQ